MDKHIVQILVVVAMIQMRSLKTDVEKGSMGNVLFHGLVDPKLVPKGWTCTVLQSVFCGRSIKCTVSSERETGSYSCTQTMQIYQELVTKGTSETSVCNPRRNFSSLSQFIHWAQCVLLYGKLYKMIWPWNRIVRRYGDITGKGDTLCIYSI